MNANKHLDKQIYSEIVKEKTPEPNIFVSCLKAFGVGGAICCVGQIFVNIYHNAGLDLDTSKTVMTMTMIFLGAFLTGFDIYDTIGQFAGAGSIIPITGFANSIVASAIEYKKEGYILGVGAKMFTIAGPVIVYGTIASVIVGLIYYFIL